MTREEYKTQVHAICDLIIDIAELNTPDDNHPSVSISIGGFSGRASVLIVRRKGEKIKPYAITPDDSFDTNDSQEAIRELEKIKALLEKERTEADETDNKES